MCENNWGEEEVEHSLGCGVSRSKQKLVLRILTHVHKIAHIGLRFHSQLFGFLFRHQKTSRSAVGEERRVSSGDSAVWLDEGWFQLRHHLGTWGSNPVVRFNRGSNSRHLDKKTAWAEPATRPRKILQQNQFCRNPRIHTYYSFATDHQLCVAGANSYGKNASFLIVFDRKQILYSSDLIFLVQYLTLKYPRYGVQNGLKEDPKVVLILII